jgi:GAF domain-containing protein
VQGTCAMTSRRLQPLIPFDCFAVYLKSGGTILPQYIDGPLAEALLPRPIPIGEGLSGWVAQYGREIMNGNPTVEPNFVIGSGSFTASSSALSIPLVDQSGAICGALTLYSRKTAAFSNDHLCILQAIQSKFSISLQNALCFRTAETDTRIDPHTQLLEGSVLV